jgi:hypothetical protein
MAISMTRARDFVCSSGVLWERALFAHLFQDGDIGRLHQCLACYRNPDGGFGHALEYDIRTPDSHPLALEYILGVFAQLNLPAGDLFDGAAAWVEAQQREDGSLRNPDSVLDYPHGPWWGKGASPSMRGGQSAPDSITGILKRLGKATPSLLESTRRWVQANVTLESIKANEWLFMAYHAFDYFFNVDDFPDIDRYRQAALENIVGCAQILPEKQYYTLLRFAPSPDSFVVNALPTGLMDRVLDYLQATQQDDGGWQDEHGLPQWYPSVTISVLWSLRQFGRI